MSHPVPGPSGFSVFEEEEVEHVYKDLETLGEEFKCGDDLDIDRFFSSDSDDVDEEPSSKPSGSQAKQIRFGEIKGKTKPASSYKRFWDVKDKFPEDDVWERLMPPFDTSWTPFPLRHKRFDAPFTPALENRPIGNSDKMMNKSLFEMWMLMFEDTMRLAMDYTNKAGAKKYPGVWKRIEWHTMLLFHKVLFRMSVCRRSNLKDYFKSEDGDTVIKSCGMSRNLFLRIYSSFTLYDPKKCEENGWSDPTNAKKYNSLYKVFNCWQTSMVSFQSCRNPDRVFSLDEIARCGFKQVLKRKPDPCGLKCDTLCGSDGYVFNSIIASKDPMPMDNKIGRISAVCYSLLTSSNIELPNKRSYLEENRVIVTDRHYTSVDMAHSFAKRGVFLIGTCMAHGRSHLPKHIMKPSVKASQLPRSQTMWQSTRDGVLDLVTWADNQPVSLLFSVPELDRVDDPSSSWTASRRFKPPNGQWTTIQVYQPNAIRYFERFMGGVDVLDHRRKSNHRHFRSFRWPLSAVWFLLLDFSVCNTYMCFKVEHPNFQNICMKSALIGQISETLNALNGSIELPMTNIREDENEDECTVQSVLEGNKTAVNENWKEVRLDNAGHLIRYVNIRGMCYFHPKTSCQFICLKCGIYLHPKFCFELFHRVDSLELARTALAK